MGPTPARAKHVHACVQCHSSRVSTFLPVANNVNCVQTTPAECTCRGSQQCGVRQHSGGFDWKGCGLAREGCHPFRHYHTRCALGTDGGRGESQRVVPPPQCNVPSLRTSVLLCSSTAAMQLNAHTYLATTKQHPLSPTPPPPPTGSLLPHTRCHALAHTDTHFLLSLTHTQLAKLNLHLAATNAILNASAVAASDANALARDRVLLTLAVLLTRGLV
jgi:hypothetical protein